MLRRRERAVVIERPALEQQVGAAADVRLQRARPLDPAKAPAQRPVRPPQRPLDTHPIDDRTGRERVPHARVDLIAKRHQSLTRLDRPRGAYSRCRRTSYTPGATRSRSCSSCTSNTGSSPTTLRYLAAGDQRMTMQRRALVVHDVRVTGRLPLGEDEPTRTAPVAPPPATRQPAPAAGRPGGSAHAGPQQNHASYPSVTPSSGLPNQPRHLSPPCR